MRIFTAITMTLAILALTVASASAASVLYDGTGSLTDVGYVQFHTDAPAWIQNGTDSGRTVLEQVDSGGVDSKSSWRLNTGTTGMNLTKATGWTLSVEFDLLSLSDSDNSPPEPGWGAASRIGDDTGAAFIMYGDDEIAFQTLTDAGGWTSNATTFAVSAGAYHRFQLTRPAGSDNITLSIDGGPVVSTKAATYFWEVMGGPYHVFGDEDNSDGADGFYNYINLYDHPVPEPSTLTLLGIGLSLLGFCRFRWR